MASEAFCQGREKLPCLWVFDGDPAALTGGSEQQASYAALLGALRPTLAPGAHFLGADAPPQPFVGAQLLLSGVCSQGGGKEGKPLCIPLPHHPMER